VIGMDKHASMRRFVTKMPGKPQVAEGEATLCGVFLVIDERTGLAARIEPVRLGGRLSQYVPSL
jgi:2',3'-cyclic-nucleotide 2'-phosphodiesterase